MMMMMNEEELIWQFLTAFLSGSFIAIISISTITLTGCGKKKEKLAESACTKPNSQLPTGSVLSKTPSCAKNSAEKKSEDKKPDEAAAAGAGAKEEKKEKTKEDEKKEEEKKPEEKKPEEEGQKTDLKTDTKVSMTNKADSTHTKEATKNTKDASKNEDGDDQYQQVEFGPGGPADLPPPPK